MFKKRFFLALALAGLSFGTATAITALTTNMAAESSAFECTGGGSESFTNIPASASAYATRTWTGDNGVAWSATDARTDQTLTGKAIALRTSTLKNTAPVSGGVGILSFNYQRVFTGNSTLKVFVNGVQFGGDITVSSTATTVYSQTINVSGAANIEIKNSLNRIIVDDINWTCYSAVAAPELQLADAANVNKDCDSLAINFGAHAVDAYNDAIFTIKNTGSAALNVSSLALSNSADFTVISPSGSFTVPASGSAIVLVRFDAVTAGAKTSVLTINSNDATEAACNVNLSGTGLVPCEAPVVTEAAIAVDGITPSSADIEISEVIADNYLAVISSSDSLTALPADAANYIVGDSIGGGVVAYNGDDASFTISGLNEASDYFVFVFPYNSVDCSEGPKYAAGLDSEFSTLVAPCIGGSETFSNLGGSSSTYAARTWVGDNALPWSATDARTDQDLTGDAIALRTGTLTNTTPAPGGMGTLSFNFKRVFTGNSVLKVFVNNVQVGGDVTVSSDSTTVFSQLVDVTGPITLRIENSGNRTIIDDITWNCYEVPNRPEIQLLDENLAPKACGFTLDFGNVQAGIDKQATFVIKNQGTQPLVIDSLALSNDVDYTILSPDVFPFAVDSLGTQDVVVRFNSAVADTLTSTLTIVSNDADEASCVVNLTAVAQNLCVAPATDAAAVAITGVTFEEADIAVTGVTAYGYIAVLSVSGVATAPTNGEVYEIGDALGTGTVAYVGTNPNFLLTDLDPSTTYSLLIYAYNDADCFDGPAYGAAIEDEIATDAAPCVGGGETFANIPASSSAYATRNWTGDNGVTWTATDARTDQTLSGKAIALRTGNVTNTVAVPGGIGTLTFNFKRVFTGNSTMKVFVNNVQVGPNITVSADTTTPFSQVVNVTGPVTIRIENSGGNRIIVDDIAWNCYATGAKQAATAKTAGTLTDDVKLYPNPSEGRFQVTLPNGAENGTIEVYNSFGKMVLSQKVAKEEVIDLGRVDTGMYMAVITAGGTVANKKIIIK